MDLNELARFFSTMLDEFGGSVVKKFIHDQQNYWKLEDIIWETCRLCESYSPAIEVDGSMTCLMCGNQKEKEVE